MQCLALKVSRKRAILTKKLENLRQNFICWAESQQREIGARFEQATNFRLLMP
jgi:hypothetical protein